MAYYRLEPFGQDMDNWRMGTIAATLVNVNGGKKGKEPAKPSDFIPQARPKKPDAEGFDPKQFMDSMKAAFGKRIKSSGTGSDKE